MATRRRNDVFREAHGRGGVRTGAAAFSLVLTVLATALLTPAPAAAVTSAWQENEQSAVRLITPYAVAPRSGEIHLGLHFTLAPGWHVYWKNSGDAGFPPEISAEGTPELGDVELLFPAPERFELPGDLVAFGYADEVVYPVRGTLASEVGSTLDLVVELDYLVCEVDCIPYRYTLRVRQPVVPARTLGGPEEGEADRSEPEPDPETAPLLDHWRARVPRPVRGVEGVATEAVLDLAELERPSLEITVTGAGAAPGQRPRVFLESHDLFDVAGAGETVFEQTPDGLWFEVPLEPLRSLRDPPRSTPFAWTVTGLRVDGEAEDAEPLAVEARRSVPMRLEAPPGPAGSPPGAPATGPDADRLPGLLPALLLALVGGLLLSLTPTTLALLLAFLAGWRAGLSEEPPRAPRSGTLSGLLPRQGAAAFSGAVAAGGLLAFVSLARGGVAWGAHLAEPATAAALTAAALLCALWLWGLLGDPEGASAPRRRGVGAAAAAGFLSPILALAWPLPPLPTATAAALAGGAAAALAAGALLGAGVGIPWLVGGLVIRHLGRRARVEREAVPIRPPERLREGLGFLAVLTVPWLLFVLSGVLRTEYLAFVELSLLVLALAAWGRRMTRSPAVRSVLAALLVAAAVAAVWLADRGRLRARGSAPAEPLRAESFEGGTSGAPAGTGTGAVG